MGPTEELLDHARQFAQRHGLVLGEQLGFGVHGIVFIAESQAEKPAAPVRSAVKALRDERAFGRERDVYLRLREHDLSRIRGCEVPRMLRYDDVFRVIEMTVVSRPFVLDFAGAYLDWPPDFSPEVIADWEEEKQDQFGPRWPEVQAILRELEAYGIFMVDVNPGNVAFGD